MGKNSKIPYVHHTFNSWWGCAKVSEGCKNCYVERYANRFGKWWWGAEKERRVFGEKHWAEPLAWNKGAERLGRPSRVLCGSMCDVFEKRDDVIGAILVQERERLWGLVGGTPWLIWMLLTKRPENVLELVPRRWLREWPRNVWMGVSVENQKAARLRLPELLKIPALVRFVSCEPLLGFVDLLGAIRVQDDDDVWDEIATEEDVGGVSEPEDFVEECEAECDGVNFGHNLIYNPEHREWLRMREEQARWKVFRRDIDWVIVGGESGPTARSTHPDWVRRLQNDCMGIPFYFKQWGEWLPNEMDPESLQYGIRRDPMTEVDMTWRRVGVARAGALLDGQECRAVPLVFNSVGG